MMRLNKILAALTATTIIASGVLAQGGDFYYGDFIATPDTGVQIVPLSLRLTPSPSLPGYPDIGGGAWRVVFDTRYVDLIVTDAGNNQKRASGAPADGSIESITLFVRSGPGLSGTFAAGFRRDTSNPHNVEFVVSVLPLAPDNTVPPSGYFEPFFRNRSSSTPLPQFEINWPAIEAAFGLNNPYRLADLGIGSFVWHLNEQGTGMRSTLATSTGSFTVIPEPASMIALGTGLAGLLALRRRRK